MAQVKKWICDGCGKAVETQLDAIASELYSIKVTAGAWGCDFHLCVKCHDRLLEQIDPRKWPRFAPAAEAPAACR